MSDRIEKTIELKAPVSRVWRALSDYREFGKWFRVRLEGPFVPGQSARGQITYPGYEHVRWEAVVRKMGKRRHEAFRMNEGGWSAQLANIAQHVEQAP